MPGVRNQFAGDGIGEPRNCRVMRRRTEPISARDVEESRQERRAAQAESSACWYRHDPLCLENRGGANLEAQKTQRRLHRLRSLIYDVHSQPVKSLVRQNKLANATRTMQRIPGWLPAPEAIEQAPSCAWQHVLPLPD